MAQQERAIETRAAIIRGAASAFEARGYGSTSLAQVSAAAGVTKGALYFHFDSKEALAVAIINAQHEASAAIGRTLLAEGVPGLRALIVMSLELARQLHEDPIVSAGVRLTIEAANFDTPVAGPYLGWIEASEEYLRRGVAEGEISADIDICAMARFLVSAFTGVQVVSDMLTGRDDIEDRLIDMWAVVMPALVPGDRWLEMKDLPTRIRVERAAA